MERPKSEMENQLLTINELKNIFFSLKTNKSASYDDISINVRKNCFVEPCDRLIYIFDLSFSSGKSPKVLKIEKATPI